MTAQVSTRKVSTRGVMATAAFRQGYEDRLSDRPMRNLDDMRGNKRKSATDVMWAYERGRLFAAYLQGEGIEPGPLKDSRGRVRWQAVQVFSDAICAQAIR